MKKPLLKEQIRDPEPEPMLEPEPDPEPEPEPHVVTAEDIMAVEDELSALQDKVTKMEDAISARRQHLVNLRRTTSAEEVRQPRREEEVPEVTWEDLAQHGIYPDE